MKKSIGYYLLHAFTWPMQLFPLEYHYLVSDFLCFFVYRIFRYRLTTVRQNLQKSFPEKSNDELLQIEQKFYHHFVDIFIETLYLTHISQKRHFKRLVFEGDELIEGLYQQGKSVICVTGHYGNWEFSRLFSVKVKHRLYAIYKKLNSPMFDRFFKDIRSKDGANLLEMRQTYKQLVSDSKNGIPYLAVFIADQRPVKSEIQYWMDFLNQDTPVLLGTEKIAKKTNAAVVWAEMQRLKRGYYKLVFRLITDDPASTEPYEITSRYMQELEKAVKRDPEFWLWTHKRWKHQR
ncbi:MAG: lysophospholipid acyltransferase family protein [Prolixibacteraceae bacterium]|nr:lysophospholipid acyltransferase family protein [Prolixibacteraceae bacterium]